MTTDISALYREFTDALTEVLAESAVGLARRGRLARAHAALKRHPEYNEQHSVWQWRLHLLSGKPCKMLAASTNELTPANRQRQTSWHDEVRHRHHDRLPVEFYGGTSRSKTNKRASVDGGPSTGRRMPTVKSLRRFDGVLLRCGVTFFLRGGHVETVVGLLRLDARATSRPL